MSFAERYGLCSDVRKETAAGIARRVETGELELLRFSFPDQHGVLRGKTMVAADGLRAIFEGCPITTTMFAKDTSHKTVFPVFTAGGGFGSKQMEGAADVVMLPDLGTFRTLPWAPKTGWFLCDVYFSDGRPVPYATRDLLRTSLQHLARQGRQFKVGLEVEFHVFKLEDQKMLPEDAGQPGSPPEVSLLSHGYQYLTEQRYDQLEPILDIFRRDVLALGLPLRSIEVEFGPSQCEFTFRPADALQAADMMVLFRSAVKQIATRNGYHATFMCRPKLPNMVSSGWHLHQSIVDVETGRNLFASVSDGEHLSDYGRHYLGGLLHHARASSLFAVPTINGYKRFRAYSLAPDRAIWGRDNRGVMIRVLGGSGDPATRLENRIGEPLANPYLYMASQLLAGLDGVQHRRDPGPSADTPYETTASALPKSILEAVEALEQDEFLRGAFGSEFVNYYLHIKKAEIARFLSEVTDWEHREYFGMF